MIKNEKDNSVGVWKMKNFEPTKEKLNKKGWNCA